MAIKTKMAKGRTLIRITVHINQIHIVKLGSVPNYVRFESTLQGMHTALLHVQFDRLLAERV